MKKIAIVGSRNFVDYPYFKSIIDVYLLKDDLSVEFVSGGAKGSDALAEQYANEHNIPIHIHYPDWKSLGKIAGRIRNQSIIDDSDELIAFWDGFSSGTKMTISFAKAKGIPYKVVYINEYLIF